MKVKAINVSNKPADFPQSKWITKNQAYTVFEMFTDLNGTETFVLEEIDLEGVFPYQGFASSRFEFEGIGPELVIEEKIEDEKK